MKSVHAIKGMPAGITPLHKRKKKHPQICKRKHHNQVIQKYCSCFVEVYKAGYTLLYYEPAAKSELKQSLKIFQTSFSCFQS